MRDDDLRQKIIEEIKRIALKQNLENGSVFRQSLFKKESNINIANVSRHFDGWTEAVTLAGFKPDTSKVKKTEDELWEEFLRVCTQLDKIPGRLDFERNTNFSDNIYVERWHNWDVIKKNFKEWLKVKHPKSKFIVQLPEEKIRKKIKPVDKPVERPKGPIVWSPTKDTFCGAPMNFRGLMYEPINEQGVIFLFGKISEEMGFNIEAIQQGFPDCDGKRLINKNKNLWEPVSIEFEYNSKAFSEHGHDPEKCDVIICWNHDWADCPLEVVELKEEIKRLRKNV